ncbi:MraY family glycosyltransferase [Pseudomonas sp. H3_G09]
MTVWWLLLVVIVASWGMTFLLRRYALAKNLIDIPNERSSHSIATPRGGGVAIVVSFLLALPLLTGLDVLSPAALAGLFGAGLLVALVGFADDHGHIAARWRLLAHFIASAWVLYWLNGFAPVEFFGATIDLLWFGDIIALVYLVWMLNLYNFMDGIDGLASSEAISVSLAICSIYWLNGFSELVWLPLLLAATVMGFLFWNFPPAKIFMGDAGSGFLGILLGALAIHAAWIAPQLLWSWIILFGVFIVDATWTLIRRLIRGDKVYQAHRSHAYQHASRQFDSHKVVTLAVVVINVVWLLPLAMWVAAGGSWLIGLPVAYLPLCWLAWKFKAGTTQD